MNCDDCQRQLSEALDAAPATAAPAVQAHLAGCPDCRAFREAVSVLDARLTVRAAPVLPADFKATLLARLPPPSRRPVPAEVREIRTQCEREHHAVLAGLWRRSFLLSPGRLTALLTVLAGGLIAALMAPEMGRLLETAGGANYGTVAGVGGALGLAAVVFGLHRARRQIFAVWRRCLGFARA